jgi:hypothetical protein
MSWSDYYAVTEIEPPEGIEGKVDGLATGPDGRLAIAFLEGGRIVRYDPSATDWQLYAEGVQAPMGVHVEDDGEILTAQRPELTRLRDTDGDGWADHYETVTDDWGFSGPQDRFANGPTADPDGNYYIGLGRPRENVPYRGWVVQVTPDGEMTPIAPGFREANGVLADSKGRVFATDQQGQWVGTSKLYHVEQGNFYGHPQPIVPADAFPHNVRDMSAPERNDLRTKACVQFPHSDLAISTTGLVEDTTGGDFGPFQNQLFVADFVMDGVHRAMLETVAGTLQGACAPGPRHGGQGAHRVTFGTDGDLWVGFTGRENAWKGERGLRRISWTGETPPAVQHMSLTEDGFTVRFTTPVDAEAAGSTDAYAMERYYYNYSARYGSDKHGQTDVSVESASVGSNGREVELTLGALEPGYVHALTMDGVTAADGTELVHDSVYYTLHRLRDGTTGDPQFG